MDNSKEFRHISLCTGYGGIDIGLRRVVPSLKTICYVEREAYAVCNLVEKIEENRLDAAPIWTDLKTFPFSSFCGKIDLISGGFPCQPFSAAGHKKGTEDPRHLWPYIKRGIEQCRPSFIFLENVLGITQVKTPQGIPVLLHVLRQLHGIGYKAEFTINRAGEFGANHSRARVFILARNSSNNKKGEYGFKILSRNKETYSNRKPNFSQPNVILSRLSKLSLGSGQWKDSERLQKQIRFLENSSKFFGGDDDDFRWMGRDKNWNEQIRLIGNGVVPDQAAAAFVELWKKLNG